MQLGKAKRGATQRPAPPPADRQLIPGWLWTIVFVLSALSLMLILYLWQPWQPAQRPMDATLPPDVVTATPTRTQTETGDYQFYDLLPKQQVTPVPAEAVPKVAPAQPAKPARPVSNSDASSASPASSTQYLLQINSYTSPDDADQKRAEVLLVGLSADVRQMTAADGVVWFRVVSGPYQTRAEALDAQRLLQDSGVDSLVVEQH